jgi:putative ABC transport system ATP-binding protein
MGPSGSGKSTLLNCAAGLESPTAGAVTVGGTGLAGLDDAALTRFRRGHIGFVFQDFNLLPYLTAYQNVELPLRLDGARIDRRRIAEVLDRVGMAHRTDRLPAQLSGGEQQRVAVARALVTRPSVKVVSGMLSQAERSSAVARLTAREREVLGLMAQGLSNAAIASSMVVTDKAVGKHISNIFMKLDLPDVPDHNRRVLAVLKYLQQPE